MSIYRANDIRGIYGTELKDEHAYALGNAFVRFTKNERIVIARDNRVSSPALYKALVRGIQEAGADVLDIGVIDSPGFYFATAHLHHPGIMVTASHNPANYNGFYVCNTNAVSINESNGLKEIEKLSLQIKKSRHQGSLFEVPIERPYLKHILSFIQKDRLRPLKVVVDAGNGVGALIATQVFGKLDIQYIPLYFESNGKFPNRDPDPSKPGSVQALAKKVRQVRADFGIAFDGDADRAAFVDEKGNFIEGSFTGALLATHLLRKHPGRNVVYSSTCSRILPEAIKNEDGKPVREKVGHTFIKIKMRKINALLGIENTGHFMFQKNFYADSGIITALMMYQIIGESKKPLSALVNAYDKYYKAPELSFHTKNSVKSLNKIIPVVRKLKPKSMDYYDGVFADFKEYWVSVRSSKTEPVVRLVVEGNAKSIVDKKVKEFSEMIKRNLS